MTPKLTLMDGTSEPALHQGSSRIAILGYHKIGPPPSGGWDTWFYIPENVFEEQLRYVQNNGWEVIGIESFLSGLETPEALPRRGVLLTFDDGYRSLQHVALAKLRKFDFPAVLFLPTDFVGSTNRWDEGVEPPEDICDWEDLKALQKSGFSIQSHGAGHYKFSTLDPAARERELQDSKAAIEARLETPVSVFSFPYGDDGTSQTETRAALERAGYRAACLYGGGVSMFPASNPYRFERLAMGHDTDLEKELG